jgi:hypothetical protein
MLSARSVRHPRACAGWGSATAVGGVSLERGLHQSSAVFVLMASVATSQGPWAGANFSAVRPRAFVVWRFPRLVGRHLRIGEDVVVKRAFALFEFAGEQVLDAGLGGAGELEDALDLSTCWGRLLRCRL